MGILFIDLGEVRTFELKDGQTIGRDKENDIVVVHPTVSRQHARIERINGRYQLTDFQSRNGTRINGKAVARSEPLFNGARIRVGHVRAWFYSSMPAALPRSVATRDRGILFKCDCGQRLWSASDTAGMSVTCGGCNQSVEVPARSQDDGTSGGTVSGVVVVEKDDPATAVCNVCQWPVEKDEKPHTCPECGLLFHAECWQENKGCSAYGCAQVNALLPKTVRPAPLEPTEAPADAYVTAAPQPKLAWAHLLLAFSVVGSLLGILTFGVPAAVVAVVSLGRLLLTRTDSKGVLFAAMLLGLIGAAAGVMISRFWWMGRPIFEWVGLGL